MAQVDWTEFVGPKYYAPAEVPLALDSLLRVVDKPSANAAYNRVLFAIGNNHAGTLYPAATVAISLILEIARSHRSVVRDAALEVATDVVLFYPEEGFETFLRPDGSVIDVQCEIASQVRREEVWLESVLADPGESDANRNNALTILDKVSSNPISLCATIRQMLSDGVPEILEKECKAFLQEYDSQ